MKKIFTTLLLTAIAFSVFAQKDTITIKHERFSTTFDTVLHYPVLVKWVILKSNIDCKPHIPRDPDMKPDPLLLKYTDLHDYYVHSGFDKGHNMSAADNGCSEKQMHECFYFSNMTAQTPQLNRFPWERLEVHTRDMADKYGLVYVQCGSFGFIKKIGIVSVPAYCWKIIKYNGVTEAYLMPNTNDVNTHDFTFYKSTVEEISKDTGLNLN